MPAFGKKGVNKNIMALSNWDTLSIDHNSKPINGKIKSKMGVQVEIYKNWLYINDKDGWTDGNYIKPIVGEIHAGALTYKDVVIYAERGPQDGIYCIVGTPAWADEQESEKLNLMVGIGCYGFDGYRGDRWTGVTEVAVDFLIGMVRLSANHRLLWAHKESLQDINFKQAQRFNQGDKYIADNLKLDMPISKVGESEEPIIRQMFKK